MFSVYVLRSLHDGRYYVGHTEDLSQRIVEHNEGRSRYTRGKGPWEVVYEEEFPTRGEAMNREREIKGRKRRTYIEQLIQNYPSAG